MAKKKKEESEALDQKALESKFEISADVPKKEAKKQIVYQPKKNFDLEAYKKIRSGFTDYKTESFIPMSDAFQKLTLFPGFPQGHVHMVYGNSDVGKTTMLLELAKYAQEMNVMPVFIITEKKWSWARCEKMGIDKNFCVYKDDISFIEEACDFITQILKDQAEGRLPMDIIFLWDSVGATPSRAEWEAYEEHEKVVKKAMEAGEDVKELKRGSGGMMVTARVLREQIERKIQHKITATRNANFPHFATLFIVNHGYISPNPMGPASLVPYGGGGIKLACSFVFRQGKVAGSAKKVKATKGGVDFIWGLQVPLILEKNHINGTSVEGEVIVTPHGYITASKESEENYKKEYSKDWKTSFDTYFEESGDIEPPLEYDEETGELL